jgi:predicted dehydrogenase
MRVADFDLALGYSITMKIETNRRVFLQTAALAGVSAWGAPRMLAAVQAAAANAPGAIPENGSTALAPPDRQPVGLQIPEIAPTRIGWAIVGLGQLALEEIMPAFRECKLSRPVALVSGHPEKAKKVAAAYGIKPTSIYDYENYDRLAENKEVDIIYIVLPNSMHAEYTMRGLRAGKHVLCEKPMSVTVEDAEKMLATAQETGRKLMIAYRLHYEPYNQKVMELCRTKAFGKIATISSTNGQDVKAPNIRLSGKLGGGPVGDVGVYSINAARYITGEEPAEVSAFAHQPTDDPRFREVPECVSFVLRYPSGIQAHCDCYFGSAESRNYRVHCKEGYVEMDPAFSYRGLRLKVKRSKGDAGAPEEAELVIPPVNHFAAEMDHFSECVIGDKKPATPGEMGVADMRIIAAIEEAVHTGEVVRVA